MQSHKERLIIIIIITIIIIFINMDANVMTYRVT